MKVILCFRQGRLALRANNKLSSVSGREDLALRANNWLSCFRQGRLALRANNFNNWLSSVLSGREVLALRAKKWLSSVSGREG